MPEYPDVTVYVERLTAFLVGREVTGLRLQSPSLVKTFDPPVRSLVGQRVTGVHRIGKRIVLEFRDDLYAVLHLMIAGRLKWRPPGAKLVRKRMHGAIDFEHGTLLLTEASTKKRMSLHVVQGKQSLTAFEPGGLDVFTATPAEFAARLRAECHTLKRSLTNPRTLDAIGNAYSDEILHRARLAPLQRTTNLDDDELATLHAACREVLTEWADRSRSEIGDGFPEKVTAFRPEMAVHGKYGQPCPVCETPVARVLLAEREWNYCPGCQTGGRLLKDRVLSRLLKEDWPKRVD